MCMFGCSRNYQVIVPVTSPHPHPGGVVYEDANTWLSFLPPQLLKILSLLCSVLSLTPEAVLELPTPSLPPRTRLPKPKVLSVNFFPPFPITSSPLVWSLSACSAFPKCGNRFGGTRSFSKGSKDVGGKEMGGGAEYAKKVSFQDWRGGKLEAGSH